MRGKGLPSPQKSAIYTKVQYHNYYTLCQASKTPPAKSTTSAPPETIKRTKQLRRKMTPAEKKLWKYLCNRQFHNL
ncbi:MAG: DUF559 domain-containing protein [Bacteroidales bacterium]|nr:DUF559 domain-containing protein [Bacteroidales bacterium]